MAARRNIFGIGAKQTWIPASAGMTVAKRARLNLRTNQVALCIVARCATRYALQVIKSFRHKGLKKYFETGSMAGIQPGHAKRLQMQLIALDTATVIEDMDIPGFKLHPLKGASEGCWSISVSGNWRLTFEFSDGNAFILDYEDYH